MLRLQNVSLARGVNILYKNVSLTTSPGERIGLVGANGSGKSTLFAAFLQELLPEEGELTLPSLDRISHVAQRIIETESRAIDFVLEGHAPLMAAKKAFEKASSSHDEMAYAAAVAHLAELNEGAIVARAHEILSGLGFKPSDPEKKVSEFSGGWRNRLALARALMRPADLLLLDEPTNHLDIDSVIWLESFLKHQEATVIVISHDREFLDRISQTVWSVEDGTICRYSGNYSQFELLRAEKLKLQEAAARSYEKTAAHLQSYIDRFRYKATKARQAQSRIKMLEKLQAVEHVLAKSQWRFTFPDPEKVPQHLLVAEDLTCGYGDIPILQKVKCTVASGARIGVLGVNGAGKSTLIRTLVGDLPKISGELRRANGLSIGYFAQHQLNDLRDDETPLQHLARVAGPATREQELRNYLGSFRFSGTFASSKVGPMSGGEKARLCLALIAWSKPNLLVLDEPTNHLDMETREALTCALSTYEGAVLLVSHDRHLLRASCDELWLVHDGALTEFSGDLDDYAELVLNSKKAESASSLAESSVAPAISRKEQRRNDAADRARLAALLKPVKKELEKVEKALEKESAVKCELDEKLADPDFYQGGSQEVACVLKTHGETSARIEELEAQWLELTEKIERISEESNSKRLP